MFYKIIFGFLISYCVFGPRRPQFFPSIVPARSIPSQIYVNSFPVPSQIPLVPIPFFRITQFFVQILPIQSFQFRLETTKELEQLFVPGSFPVLSSNPFLFLYLIPTPAISIQFQFQSFFQIISIILLSFFSPLPEYLSSSIKQFYLS